MGLDIEVTTERIVEYVKDNLHPHEVFPEYELAQWAEDNGYIKETE